MIINRPGAEWTYNGVTYVIGAPIIATNQSEYEGLYGRITEVRDGKDKETENETPDLYCDFDPPVMPRDIAALEEIFSDLYQEPRTLDEIILDFVIMAPEMVEPLPVEEDVRTLTVYKVVEDWVIDGEEGLSEALFTDLPTAKRARNALFSDAVNSDWMARWEKDPAFAIEEQDGEYECFLDGDYCANHYRLRLSQMTLQLGYAQFQQIGEEHTSGIHRKDFEESAKQIAKEENLTDVQYDLMLKDPDISALISRELEKNDPYWEAYWQSVDDVVHTLIQKYRAMGQPDVNDDDSVDPDAF